MIKASEARKELDKSVAELTLRTQKLFEEDRFNIEDQIIHAINSCENAIVISVSYEFFKKDYKTASEINIFVETFHHYYRDLGYTTRDWESFFDRKFEIAW